MITAKEMSMNIDEQISWMETHTKMLSESLRVLALLIKDEKDDTYDHIPEHTDIIKEAQEHFKCISEELEYIGWISLLDKGTAWYEDLIHIAVCYNKDPSIFRKAIHEECNRAIEIWNDMVYVLMN